MAKTTTIDRKSMKTRLWNLERTETRTFNALWRFLTSAEIEEASSARLKEMGLLPKIGALSAEAGWTMLALCREVAKQKEGMVYRDGDGVVCARLVGDPSIEGFPGVVLVNPKEAEASAEHAIYEKRFPRKSERGVIWLPKEAPLARAYLKEQGVRFPVGANGFTRRFSEQEEMAYGVTFEKYLRTVHSLIIDSFSSLFSAHPALRAATALVHGNTKSGVDDELMKAADELGLLSCGTSCPLYVMEAEDDPNVLTILAANQNDYSLFYAQLVIVLIGVNGKKQSFSMDTAHLFNEAGKRYIPADVLSAVSWQSTGVPGWSPTDRSQVINATRAISEVLCILGRPVALPVASYDELVEHVIAHLKEAAVRLVADDNPVFARL